DPKDRSNDPEVFHWDDEGEKDEPTLAFRHLSHLLTHVVVRGTLELEARHDGIGPLGKLQPEVRFMTERDDSLSDDTAARERYRGWPQYAERVRKHVKQLKPAPWPIPDLEVRRTADRSLLVYERRIVTCTRAAWDAIEPLLGQEAAASKEK